MSRVPMSSRYSWRDVSELLLSMRARLREESSVYESGTHQTQDDELNSPHSLSSPPPVHQQTRIERCESYIQKQKYGADRLHQAVDQPLNAHEQWKQRAQEWRQAEEQEKRAQDMQKSQADVMWDMELNQWISKDTKIDHSKTPICSSSPPLSSSHHSPSLSLSTPWVQLKDHILAQHQVAQEIQHRAQVRDRQTTQREIHSSEKHGQVREIKNTK